jgi:hypothetical protein
MARKCMQELGSVRILFEMSENGEYPKEEVRMLTCLMQEHPNRISYTGFEFGRAGLGMKKIAEHLKGSSVEVSSDEELAKAYCKVIDRTVLTEAS